MVAIIVIAPVAVILMHTVPATAVAIIPMAVIIMAAGPVAMIVMMAAIAVVVIVSAAGIRITVPIPWRIAITDADAHRPAVDATVAVIAAPVVITAGGAIAIIVITLARVVTAWRGVIPGIRADIFRRHDAAAQEQ